jgi:hypothetical protein
MRHKHTPAFDWHHRFEYVSYWASGAVLIELAFWALCLVLTFIVWVGEVVTLEYHQRKHLR